MRYLIFGIGLLMLFFNGPAFARQGGTVITPTNVSQLQPQQTIGNGRVLDIQWSPDGQWLGVLTSQGVWLNHKNDLTGTPVLIGAEVSPVLSFTIVDGYVILGHQPTQLYDIEEAFSITAWSITGAFMYGITTPTTGIIDIAISADGLRLATADLYFPNAEAEFLYPRINLWDLDTFALVATLEDPTAGQLDFGNILFAGDYLVTNLYYTADGPSGSLVKVWNASDGTFFTELDIKGRQVWASPDGKWIAGLGFPGYDNSKGIACTLANECQVFSDPAPESPFPSGLAFTGDNTLLLSYYNNRVFKIGLTDQSFELAKDVALPINGMVVNPTNAMVSVYSDGFFLHYPDLAGNATVTAPFFNHGVQDILVHPDNGQIFAIEGNDHFGFTEGKLVIWDSAGTKISELADSTFMTMSFDTTATQIGLGDASGRVFIFDLMTQQIEIIPISEECGVVGITFHPDSTRLATVEALPNYDCPRDNPVKIYSLLDATSDPFGVPAKPVDLLYASNGQLFLLTEDAFAFGGGTSVPVEASELGGIMELRDLVLSPNSQFLVATGQVSYLGGWGSSGLWKMDAASGALTYANAHTAPIRGSAISPDSSLIATASADGTVNIYAEEDLMLLHTLPMYGGANAVQFSADGTLLYVGGEDGTIKVWGIP